ncbi:MAG TPA: T9SS type A sorting domain-containing protein [Candidatus Eisenbacteria bacterium]|jgi:hypothetical protein
MNIRSKVVGLLAAALALTLGVGVAQAAKPVRSATRPFGTARPFAVRTSENDRRIDVNNLNMFVSNYGAFAYDTAGNYNGGLFFPNHTPKTAIFAAGLWIGAKVGPDYRATVAEYDQEYRPGRILSSSPVTTDDPGDPALVVYKVNRFRGSPSDTAHVDNPNPADVAFARGEDLLVHHSWSEYMAGAVPFGAPWKLWRLDNTATPAPGDSVDVPGPDLLGDQMCWCVYNDALQAAHSNEAGSTDPLDVQVVQTTFAFDRLGALGNTIFIKYVISNRGPQTLDSVFVAQWSDPDLGGFTDDVVGCDTLPDKTGKSRSLGYVYNGTNNDEVYGSTPPALGFDFLKGPISGPDTLGLTSFAKYINGTDPVSSIETYNWMRGFTTDANNNPDPIVDPFGHVTKFMVAGDPIVKAALGNADVVNWVDSSPADRRFFLSSGPFTMAPGDSQEVIVAIVVGQCGDRLRSLQHLKFVDDAAQEAFNLGFDIPPPPRSPVVTGASGHGVVNLTWDRSGESDAQPPGYTFEGYNVYQGSTIAGPWRFITAFDAQNGIREVDGLRFDDSNCEILPLAPLAHGTDFGLGSSYSTSQDFVNGTSVKDGTDYYYAVTAYAVNPSAVPAVRVLESSLKATVVRPQRAASTVTAGQVRPVPNPYYAHSAYELTQFARRIRFLNVPPQATIRIYNLAGQLIRTLEKNDPSTSVLEWDIHTDNGLPVGSGVYVYHVKTPGGDSVGRLVVLMEKERLNNF